MFSLQYPTGGLNNQVCSPAYELAVTLCWPTFTYMTRVNSRIWLCPILKHYKYNPGINNIIVKTHHQKPQERILKIKNINSCDSVLLSE